MVTTSQRSFIDTSVRITETLATIAASFVRFCFSQGVLNFIGLQWIMSHKDNVSSGRHSPKWVMPHSLSVHGCRMSLEFSDFPTSSSFTHHHRASSPSRAPKNTQAMTMFVCQFYPKACNECFFFSNAFLHNEHAMNTKKTTPMFSSPAKNLTWVLFVVREIDVSATRARGGFSNNSANVAFFTTCARPGPVTLAHKILASPLHDLNQFEDEVLFINFPKKTHDVFCTSVLSNNCGVTSQHNRI